MATQDDLAALFQQHLTLNQQPVYYAPQPEPTPAPYVYSISQHYHHSMHVPQQPSRPASEPPQTDQLTTEIILGRHGIDIATLSPQQIGLFKTAHASQQMRLIELWRICPPDYTGHALAQEMAHWSATSLEQEEAMAKLRYERQMMDERMSRTGGDQHSDTMSDASISGPLTPIQAGDGRWQNESGAEPYMQSGYEVLAQREYEKSVGQPKDIYSHFGSAVGGPNYVKATDPVYNTVQDIHTYSNGSDWERQQSMENQYGAYQQHFHHDAAGVTVAGHDDEDEEML